MAQQNIETTDNLPTLRTKLNSNFDELYAAEVASIGDISDVTLTAPANGEVLTYNGTAWVNGEAVADYLPLSGGTMAGTINMNSNQLTLAKFGVATGDYNGLGVQDGTTQKAYLLHSTTNNSNPYRIDGVTLVSDGTAGLLLAARGGGDLTFITGTTTRGWFSAAGNLILNYNLYVPSYIYHVDDTDTYMQFHNTDQWRVVTGGGERIEANNTDGILMSTARVSGTFRIPVK